MFDLVEREDNNCKYINRHTSVLTALRAKLKRKPIEIEYSFVKVNDLLPTRGNFRKEIRDFDGLWLSRNENGFEISRKNADSVFLQIKTHFPLNNIGNLLWYRLNGGPANTATENLDIQVCTVDATDLTAIIMPDDAIFNCCCIQTFGKNPDYPSSTVTHRNCLLIGARFVEDNCNVNFEILAKPRIKKDFRIQILDDKGKMVEIEKMKFLVKIEENQEKV